MSAQGPAAGPGEQGGRRPATTIDLTATEVDPVAPQRDAASPGKSRASSNLSWPLAAACVTGLVLTLIVLAAAGVFGRDGSDTAALEARLARMEQQLHEFAARPPVAIDQKPIDDMADRLRRLETAAAKSSTVDPNLANRLATLEGQIRAVDEKLGALARRSDEIASLAAKRESAGSPDSTAQIEALSNRIAELERTVKSTQAELARRSESERTGDRALRRIVVANALLNAVGRGTPFVAELDAATSLAPDPRTLTPLAPFAKTGVPDTDALARELVALIPAIGKSIETPSGDGGLLDRLKASAERIVRVRPVDEAAGDNPTSILQRIESRAAQGNLTGAMTELAKLPAPAQALAKEWGATVEARNAAIEASRRFSAEALDAAGKLTL
jgi:hypothetical protein